MKRKINPFSKIAALAAIIVTLSALVAPALATTTALVNDSELLLQNWTTITNGVTDGRGRTFQGNDQYLSSASFYFRNFTVTLSGTLRAYLINNSDLTHTSDVYPVETTAAIDISGLGAPGWVTFYFANTTILLSTNYYTINFVLNSSLSGALQSGYWVTGANEGGYHAGGSDLETWDNSNAVQLAKIYTVDTLGGDSDPYVPPGTADTTTYDNIISGFVTFMVPLLIILLPAFLLCFIARRVDKWLILMGITIGAGLGYYLMPAYVPLWLVFLITIGLIGMAYQSVRGGNS